MKRRYMEGVEDVAEEEFQLRLLMAPRLQRYEVLQYRYDEMGVT